MRPSILYLDDETALLELFQEAFGVEYDVRTASTLDAARRMLIENGADIIISDQYMPEIDGTDFLRETARLYPQSLRILMSGYVTVGDVMGEVGMGIINIFVPKPWTEAGMRQVLERASLALDSLNPPVRPQGERRIAPRHQIKLETRVLMIAEQEIGGEEQEILTLTGYTYDISESGIGLIVTREDIEVLSGFRESYILRLVLPLPTGPVELTVSPMRQQQLDEVAGKESKVIIGAQIRDMNGRDRVRFIEYIRNLEGLTQP